METCLGFNIDCGILAKGIGVVLMSLTLFVGSVYLLLTAVLGSMDGVPGPDGLALGLADHALGALGVRLLLAGPGHARQPRSPRRGARLGPAPGLDR